MKKIKYALALAAALTIIGAPTAAFATEPVVEAEPVVETYVLAIWQNEAGSPKFPQALVTSSTTTSTDITGVLDPYTECGTFYQADLYADDETTAALITKGILNGGDESWPDGVQRYDTKTTEPCPVVVEPPVVITPAEPPVVVVPADPQPPVVTPELPTETPIYEPESPVAAPVVEASAPVVEADVAPVKTAVAAKPIEATSLAFTGDDMVGTVAYWSGGAIAVGLMLVVATAVRVERKRRAELR